MYLSKSRNIVQELESFFLETGVHKQLYKIYIFVIIERFIYRMVRGEGRVADLIIVGV